MKAIISPSKANGNMYAPSSKSVAHRLMICAGLSKGESTITHVSDCQDVQATLDCLNAFPGISCSYDNETVHITNTNTVPLASNNPVLPCRECGSTIRFFIPICLLSENEITLTGSERLLKRPLSVYENICKEQGLFFENNGEKVVVKGPLKSGKYVIPGNISSQFITGLLFALPLLEGDSSIEITDSFESRSYIDLTLNALKEYGVDVFFTDDRTISIKGSQRYKSKNTSVEGDYSNAAFFSALNYLGGNITLDGLNKDSAQGDRVYEEYFKALSEGTPTLSLKDCPDLGPIMFVMASLLNGATFTDTERLRIKESDRIATMKEELIKAGINIEDTDNTVVIKKQTVSTPSDAFYGHNDHRIVMALSVLATVTGGTITGAQAVSKSVPDFFERIKSLGIDVCLEMEDQ